MCSNAIPCPIRWASCDYRLYWLAVNRTFLLQRIEILMLLNWFFRFDLCLWLKLSARVVTWLESREHQIVDVFTGNLRVLSSSRSSRSFTDCISFYAHFNDYKNSIWNLIQSCRHLVYSFHTLYGLCNYRSGSTVLRCSHWHRNSIRVWRLSRRDHKMVCLFEKIRSCRVRDISLGIHL